MRLPLLWLADHCDPGLPASELAERLALTGTEVERIEHHGVASLECFVVGRVLEAEQHPQADRLRVCSVDLGDGEPRTIVCGAPNVAAGQTVAVARPGAVMPDGTALGAAELRGVRSEGMILAEDELAIGTDHDGILVLEDGLAPGAPLAGVLPIATDVLELEITPNRPDCLGVYGVAREVHAATGAPLGAPPWTEDPGSDGAVAGIEIAVECPDLCPRFTARVFEDVTIGSSPAWLKARLMAAGQRPISNVVDITNYVMLLTGQPLHAFDLDRIAGGRLVVRRANAGERVETLDGQTRELDGEMVLIADADGPTSIAGVMGGARSEVHDGTTRVLMEAATWNGPNIKRSSTRLGLRSEASGRFEKGLQPEQAMWAQAVAARLMVELCGARLADGTADVGEAPPAPAVVELRDARVERLLGAPIARERSAEILGALGFETAERESGLAVTVPSWRRGDVAREADLIEEVARIDGLDRLPASLPARRSAIGGLSERQQARRRAADALAARGLHEVVGWSFATPELADRLLLDAADPRRAMVALRNPMSADQSAMRSLLLGSLLDVARHNRAHDLRDVRIFEQGAIYGSEPDLPPPGAPTHPGLERLPRERRHLGALVTGPVRPASWRDQSPPPADFFAIKGLLGGLLDTLRVPWRLEPAGEPFLHPGRSAAVLAGDMAIGWVGELHPQVASAWDLGPASAFELDLDAALDRAAGEARFEAFGAFPEARIDIAVVVPEAVAVGAVLDAVRSAGGPLLARAEVFDVYSGDQVGAGNVSLAVRLAFAAPDRTLGDDDVAAARAAIEAELGKLGGSLRA